ncbi:MAG: prolyl oligopeptidase family serine peptidase [Christensenellales bacterium]
MRYPEIISIPANPSLRGMAEVLGDITYSTATGQDLKLSVILPWSVEGQPLPRRPLIVFVQGSAWTSPNINYQLPQLSRYAQFGNVAATLTHRDSTRGNPFPAYLQDVKTAIRFLRANAALFGIDPGRVCIFGTSSGGNAALLVGLTADDPRYKTEEHQEQSDAVQAVISCFGPTDVSALVAGHEAEFAASPIYTGLLAGHSLQEVLRQMSPIEEIKPGRAYPPILLAAGDADQVVPFLQSEQMFHALIDAGADARLVKVIGAPHEGSFWSNRLHGLLADFLRETLQEA